ncbi:MAG TPA: transglycosylase SLT domain-containing protein [Burkholderiales bacterium]|nr:transglycosylase SLT domain-containing protein [Burkholderiales bacterium]
MREDLTPAASAHATSALRRIFSLASGVFALLGFTLVLVVAVPKTRDGILSQLQALAWHPVVPGVAVSTADRIEMGGPAAPAQALQSSSGGEYAGDAVGSAAHSVPVVAQDQAEQAEQAEQAARAALTQFIANRYRVADEVVTDIVYVAFRAAEAQALDPLVVLAVVATESGYNPIAESVAGAKGLMQIIAKFHAEKLAPFGGEDALFEPEVNIRVGSQILRDYLRRFGDLEIALQVYAGALDDADARYARKVFAERDRLQQALERSRREA